MDFDLKFCWKAYNSKLLRRKYVHFKTELFLSDTIPTLKHSISHLIYIAVSMYDMLKTCLTVQQAMVSLVQ